MSQMLQNSLFARNALSLAAIVTAGTSLFVNWSNAQQMKQHDCWVTFEDAMDRQGISRESIQKVDPGSSILGSQCNFELVGRDGQARRLSWNPRDFNMI